MWHRRRTQEEGDFHSLIYYHLTAASEKQQQVFYFLQAAFRGNSEGPLKLRCLAQNSEETHVHTKTSGLK